MPVRAAKLRNSGLVFIEHTCEVCGAYACFGEGVSLRQALNLIIIGKVAEGQKLLGRWFCGLHRSISV